MRDFGWHHLNNRVAESAVHLPVPQLLSAHLLPDGRGVVSLRQEGGPPGKDPLRTKAIVWDLTRQSPVREWTVRGRPRLSALSPDGTRIAFEATTAIEIHDLKEGKLVRTLPRPAGGSLLNLTFLGDGTLVGHCFDQNSNFLQLWDVAGGKPTRTVPLREQAQAGVFTADGAEFRLHAFAGREEIVETYSLAPGAKNPRSATTLARDGIFLTLTPDGNRSVCYRHLPVREAAVVVVDHATRQVLARWPLDTGTYPRVACHPALPLVAFSRENRVHVGDVSSGRIVQTFTYPATDTLALRFSSDGASLFAVQKDGCRLWGLEQKAPVRTVLFPPGSSGGHPQVDPTGNYCLTTQSSQGAKGKSPLVSFADDKPLLEDVPNLQRLHFSQDAKRLLVGESHQHAVYEFPEMKSVYRVERLALQGFEPVPRTPLGADGGQLALFRRKALSATEQALELKVLRLPDGKPVAQLSLLLKKDNSTVLDWLVDPRGERVLISRQEVKGKEVESILEEHFLADGGVRQLHRQQHTARTIWAPAYSPDGSRVVAFTGQCLATDREIELRAWDAKTGEEAWRVPGTSGAGFHALKAHFSSDGNWLATGMLEKGKTTLIVPATGEKHLTVDGVTGVSAIDELPVFSPDGSCIVVLDKPGGTAVTVRSVQTGKVLFDLKDQRQCEMAGFGLHAPVLITSDFDAQTKTVRARIWSAKDGQLIGRYPGDHPRPSGEYGVREGSTEQRVGAQVHRLGEKLALWSQNFAADVRGPERLTVRGEFDPQGRRVALADWFGKEVVVCDAATGAVLHRRKQVCPDQGHVQVMRFDPAGEMLFVGVSRPREDRGLMLGWNLAADSVTTYELPPKESVFDVAFLPGGERVLGISATGLVHVWNLKTGAAFPSFEGKPLTWKWRIPRLSPDGHFLGVQSRGATDDAFLLWDTRTGRRVALEDTAGLHPRAATFSEDSRQVIMAVQDGGKKNSIMIWDLLTGARVRHIAGLAGDPLALELTDKGRRCLVVGADRISFWDLQSGLKVMDFPRPGGETGILGGRFLERSQTLVQFTNREVTLYDGSRHGEGPRASEIPR
jgi:WD40 repeat protein